MPVDHGCFSIPEVGGAQGLARGARHV